MTQYELAVDMPQADTWVVRNAVTGHVYVEDASWHRCDMWVNEHSDRYVVVERRGDYKSFDQYVALGLLRNAGLKTRTLGVQETLI
jgi:hypothetical protein